MGIRQDDETERMKFDLKMLFLVVFAAAVILFASRHVLEQIDHNERLKITQECELPAYADDVFCKKTSDAVRRITRRTVVTPSLIEARIILTSFNETEHRELAVYWICSREVVDAVAFSQTGFNTSSTGELNQEWSLNEFTVSSSGYLFSAIKKIPLDFPVDDLHISLLSNGKALAESSQIRVTQRKK